MVEVYRTEDEQVDAVKRWIREYGLITVVAVLLAFGATWTWRYYQQNQSQKIENASLLFDVVQLSQKQQDMTNFNDATTKLVTDYPKTPYAIFAAFYRASQAASDGKYEIAEKELQWAMDNAKSSSFKQIARLRLARVYLQEKKNNEALELMQTIDNKTFEPVVAEIKGDAYSALGQFQQAATAYDQAINGIETSQPYRQLIEMKYYQVKGEIK